VVTLAATNAAGRGDATTTLDVTRVLPPCPLGTLCALGNRFQLNLFARDHRTGATASGLAFVQNDLFGYFTLPGLTGDVSNPEVFVKMLDGRSVNGSYWVFFGGLTDLEYTLKVVDVVDGSTKSYLKPAGSSRGGFDVGGGLAPETCPNEVDGRDVAAEPAVPCTPSADRLCLAGERFSVRLAARDLRTNRSADGVSRPRNATFGYFTLPGLTNDAENPEVFVKMMDGRAVNGSFWIFYGGLTDLEYTLTVTDSTTGRTKQYSKAFGTSCGAFDVSAFDD